MAASESSKTKIQQMYVAYYGRPGDPAGIEYWGNVLDVAEATGGSIDSIISAFGNSDEYTTGIGTGSTSEQVTTLYQQMFNRDPEADGLAFWVNEIDSGARTLGEVALAIAESAQNDDATTLANKVTAANYYTNQVSSTGASYDSGDIAAAKAIIAGVTADAVTVVNSYTATDSQLATQGGTGTAGQTFTLTNSTVTGSFDNVQGGVGDDTFTAGPATLETGDVIDGGAGIDTLNSQDAASGAAPTIKNVEILNIRNDMSASDSFSLNDVTGVTEVWADRLTNTANTLTINGAGLTQSVTVGVVKGGSTTAADVNNVTFTFSDVSGNADSASLKLDSANAGVVTIAGVETLNVATMTGASKLDTGLAASSAATINFTGDQNVTIDATDFAAQKYTVDASGMSGNLDITLEDQAAGRTVTGGSGNDAIRVVNLTGLDSIDGGTGTNTFSLTDTSDLDATTGAKIKNVQLFDLVGADGTAVDMDHITGGGSSSTITGLTVSGALGAAQTVNDLVASGGVNIMASTGFAITVNQKGASAAGSNDDTLTYDISGASANVTVTGLTTPNVETITINSAVTTGKTTGHTITATTFANAGTVNFTGDEQLTVTALGAATATKIDASAMTDKFIMTNASDAATILLLTGGSANDTLVIDDGTQLTGTTVDGNGGADTINLDGAANTTNNLKIGEQSDTTAAAYDEVVGFEAAANAGTSQDIINVSAFSFAAAAKTVVDASAKVTMTGTQAGASETFAISAANSTGFFHNGVTNVGIAFADSGTDTWVFIDANKDGNWDASTDSVLILGAMSDTLAAADFNFG